MMEVCVNIIGARVSCVVYLNYMLHVTMCNCPPPPHHLLKSVVVGLGVGAFLF